MNFLKNSKKEALIWDGGMGSLLIDAKKSPRFNIADERLVCSEAFNLYAPEVVEFVHASYIEADVDVIETNAFSANRISLAEYGLQNRVKEINVAAVSIAKKSVAKSGRDVLIAGNLGPTSKLPSMGQISFDDIYGAYFEQIEVLVEEGVDLIQIETCQDILQAKAAVIAAIDCNKRRKERLPIVLSVTIDNTGRLLLGTELDSVLTTFIPLGVDVIGLNCGLGPKGMEESVRFLYQNSPLPILLMPNAGLPEIVNGETKYNLGPEDFSEEVSYYVKNLGVEMVGGCCGTTPEHIRALAKKLKGTELKKRDVVWKNKLSSLFTATNCRQRPAPLIIGERMNVNGSKRFKEALLADNFNFAVSIIGEQEEKGAHVLDLSVAYAGRNEIADFQKVLENGRAIAKAPFCIDSTNPVAIEAALKMVPGRSIVNSINLEDGGKKAGAILNLVQRFGAAVVALTIDEEGMARDKDKKIKIAERIINLCLEYGLKEEDIFIDLLTFTLAEPRAAEFGSGAHTLNAISELKKKRPDLNLVLGVSNVSYGLKKNARKVLNSVFLREAIIKGLDAAIIDAGQIVPVSGIDWELLNLALDLVWNKRKDALERFIKHFETTNYQFEEIAADISPEEGVRASILKGDKLKISGFVGKLVKKIPAKEILDSYLLPAMQEVGRLFDKGDMPLPFVLKSAEAMKSATDTLSKYFKKDESSTKGKILLATVRGDVHDIGKDLVDIVLSNNGFEVVNIGVKQPLENILKAAGEYKVNIIGLSGLLVESALIMKEDLAEMAHRGIRLPVICGGAALTEKFVSNDLTEAYGKKVYYAKDAFDGLKIIREIIND